jgi:hypothetical protein
MASLKKRSTAAVVAAVVILLGTLLGVHLSVNRQTAKIEAQFYKGVYLTDEKYVQPGIQPQLDKRATAALGLESLASNYSDLTAQTEALRSARRALMETPSIQAKYVANSNMQAAYEKLYAALLQHTLNDTERTSSASYAATLDGAQGVIGQSAYNSLAGDYLRDLNAFPVNILKNLAFVNYPEYFGAEG